MKDFTFDKSSLTLVMTQSSHNEIINTVGSKPAESLAVLMGNPDDNVIQTAIFDKQSHNTRVTTTPNGDYLNPEIQRIANKQGWVVLGIIHSQPGLKTPSKEDLVYFGKMCEAFRLDKLETPIAFTVPDGGFKIFPYRYDHATGSITKTELLVISDEAYQRHKGQLLKSTDTQAEQPNKLAAFKAKVRHGLRAWAMRPSLLSRASFNLLVVLLSVLVGWVAISITPALIVRLTENLLP